MSNLSLPPFGKAPVSSSSPEARFSRLSEEFWEIAVAYPKLKLTIAHWESSEEHWFLNGTTEVHRTIKSAPWVGYCRGPYSRYRSLTLEGEGRERFRVVAGEAGEALRQFVDTDMASRIGVWPHSLQATWGLSIEEANQYRWMYAISEVGWHLPDDSAINVDKCAPPLSKWGMEVLRMSYSPDAVKRMERSCPPGFLPPEWIDGLPIAFYSEIESVASHSMRVARFIGGELLAVGVSKQTPRTSVKPKRSTEKGEARVKLIAALTKHHQYANGSCLNSEPIGSNALARLAKVSESTASSFFNKEFAGKGQKNGHKKYVACCQDISKLVGTFKVLHQEFAPHHLFGTKPPGERDRYDEE